MPWRRGARRRQPCQRAFKGTLDPQKKGKQMAAGNEPARALHLFSPGNLLPLLILLLLRRRPELLFNQWPMRASRGFEVEECLNAAPVHAASHHKAPEGLAGPRRHTFSSRTEVKARPSPLSTLPLLCTKKQLAGRQTQQKNKSADTSDEQHIKPSREQTADWKKRHDKSLFAKNKSIKGTH